MIPVFGYQCLCVSISASLSLFDTRKYRVARCLSLRRERTLLRLARFTLAAGLLERVPLCLVLFRLLRRLLDRRRRRQLAATVSAYRPRASRVHVILLHGPELNRIGRDAVRGHSRPRPSFSHALGFPHPGTVEVRVAVFAHHGSEARHVDAAEILALPLNPRRVPPPTGPTRAGRSAATGACERCLCQFYPSTRSAAGCSLGKPGYPSAWLHPSIRRS